MSTERPLNMATSSNLSFINTFKARNCKLVTQDIKPPIKTKDCLQISRESNFI